MATKGQKQIFRTENEKYEIIKPILENIKSQTQVSKETGKIFTMPGLPRIPAAESININENNEIVGIF